MIERIKGAWGEASAAAPNARLSTWATVAVPGHALGQANSFQNAETRVRSIVSSRANCAALGRKNPQQMGP